MSKKTYSEKLKNPKWQKKRLEIMERDKWHCQACGDNRQTLNIHHIEYLNNCEPWDYPNILLITLCDDCHKIEHSKNIQVEIEKIIKMFQGVGILKIDIRNLLEALLEQSSRSHIGNLEQYLYANEKSKLLILLDSIKAVIASQ